MTQSDSRDNLFTIPEYFSRYFEKLSHFLQTPHGQRDQTVLQKCRYLPHTQIQAFQHSDHFSRKDFQKLALFAARYLAYTRFILKHSTSKINIYSEHLPILKNLLK